MAQPTTPSHPGATPPQAPTPGVAATPGSVARMGPSPTIAAPSYGPDVKTTEPVLFEDLDKVLLLRLYPETKDAQSDALAAANATHTAGAEVKAAQQDPGDRVASQAPTAGVSLTTPPPHA